MKDTSLPAHSIEFVEQKDQYIAKLENEIEVRIGAGKALSAIIMKRDITIAEMKIQLGRLDKMLDQYGYLENGEARTLIKNLITKV